MKSDPVFVDEFLQDLIHHYSISNKDAMIQSDNAPMQYKNCCGFALLQKLANIGSFCTYGAKNVLRRDIVTQDIFFDTSGGIVDYLHIKNPRFYYASIDPGLLARKRHNYNEHGESIEIKGCIKQYLFVYKSNSTEIICRVYLCECFEYIQLHFNNC